MARRALLLLAALLAGGAAPLAEGVMAGIAALPSRSTGFTEEKTLPGLSQPLLSSGRVVFTRPDHLEQITEAPQAERVVIDGDRLGVELASGERRDFALSENPALGLLAQTLRAVLQGDLATLRALFVIEEQGDMANWRLMLTPRVPAMQRFLARVTVDGRQAGIAQIVIQQADGGAQRLMLR